MGEKPDQVCLAFKWPKTPVLVRKPSVSQQASGQLWLRHLQGKEGYVSPWMEGVEGLGKGEVLLTDFNICVCVP